MWLWQDNIRFRIFSRGGKWRGMCSFYCYGTVVKLLDNVRQYDFFDMRMVDKGLINVFDMDVLYSWLGLTKATFDLGDIHALIKAITDIVNTIGVTRLVIDSVTTLCYKIQSEQLIRDFLFTLGKKLSTLGCTTLLISEITSEKSGVNMWSSFGVEEAISDGIIVLGDVERMGHLLRFLQVVKMREHLIVEPNMLLN